MAKKYSAFTIILILVGIVILFVVPALAAVMFPAMSTFASALVAALAGGLADAASQGVGIELGDRQSFSCRKISFICQSYRRSC